MNSDIRILITFRNNRKRRKLDLLLGENSAGYLVDLWIGAAISRADGVLQEWDAVDIALEANYPGDPEKFLVALKEAGFVDETEGIYFLHNWGDRQKWAASDKDRSLSASKKVLRRWVVNQLSKKEYADFHSWYDTVYEHSMENNASVILNLYKQYTNCNTVVDDQYTVSKENHTNSSTPLPLPLPLPLPKDIIKKQKKQKFDPVAFRPDYVPVDLWDCLLQNRKFKKLESSELALKTMCNQFELAIEKGFAIEDCISTFVEGGWTRFKKDWMENLQESNRQGPKKSYQTKQDINNKIQEIGAAIHAKTRFDPYKILNSGDSIRDVDQDSRALPE